MQPDRCNRGKSLSKSTPTTFELCFCRVQYFARCGGKAGLVVSPVLFSVQSHCSNLCSKDIRDMAELPASEEDCPHNFYVGVLFPCMSSISMTNIDPNRTALVADRLRQGRSRRKEFLSRDGVLTTIRSRNFIFNVMEVWKFFLSSWEGESLNC